MHFIGRREAPFAPRGLPDSRLPAAQLRVPVDSDAGHNRLGNMRRRQSALLVVRSHIPKVGCNAPVILRYSLYASSLDHESGRRCIQSSKFGSEKLSAFPY